VVNRAIRERLSKAHAPRTNSTYRSAVASYEMACRLLRVPAWPASEGSLITYASFAHEAWHLRPGTIDTYISAIAHAQRMQGWEHPRAGDGLLKLVLDGCRRMDRDRGVGPRPRVGIDGRMLRQLLQGLDGRDYRSARFAAYASCSYFGGFRANELISTQAGERFHWSDLTFKSHLGEVEYMSVRQWVSKTRQFGPTMDIPVCRTKGPTCPVDLMRRYMAFHPTQPGERAVFTDAAGSQPYTYAQALLDTRHFGQALAVPPEELGTHSFRIGMASEAGRLNFPPHTIKALGRWDSDCYMVYIHLDPLTLARAAARLAG